MLILTERSSPDVAGLTPKATHKSPARRSETWSTHSLEASIHCRTISSPALLADKTGVRSEVPASAVPVLSCHAPPALVDRGYGEILPVSVNCCPALLAPPMPAPAVVSSVAAVPECRTNDASRTAPTTVSGPDWLLSRTLPLRFGAVGEDGIGMTGFKLRRFSSVLVNHPFRVQGRGAATGPARRGGCARPAWRRCAGPAPSRFRGQG